MVKFSKKISNFLFWIVALLGLSFLFQEEIKKIGLEIILVLAAIILFGGFTYLIIVHISELEKRINDIEEKFIRERDLNKIKADIKAIKLIINKK